MLTLHYREHIYRERFRLLLKRRFEHQVNGRKDTLFLHSSAWLDDQINNLQ